MVTFENGANYSIHNENTLFAQHYILLCIHTRQVSLLHSLTASHNYYHMSYCCVMLI